MRRVFLTVSAFVWVALLFAVIAPLAVIWPTLAWRNRLSLLAGRWWSGLCLRLAGIRLEIEGREHLEARPAILTFNHSNYLDFYVLAFLVSSRCLVFGKRALARLPFLGWGWFLGGHPLIKRDDPGHWKRGLDRVVRLVKEEGYSTIVAPEGRRNRTGQLLPFKKGPFHLAIDTGRPIVPVVILGGASLWEGATPQRGTVRMKLLPPLQTTGWSRQTIDEHVQALRALYLRELGQEDRVEEDSPVPNSNAS